MVTFFSTYGLAKEGHEITTCHNMLPAILRRNRQIPHRWLDPLARSRRSSYDQDMTNDRTPRTPLDAREVAPIIAALLTDRLQTEAAVRLLRLTPPDQGDVFTQLSVLQQRQLVHQLSPSALGHLIDFLEPEVAASLSLMVSSSTLPLVLDAASPDVAADVLKELPDTVAAAAIEHMTSGREVASLLEYDDDDAGGLMTPEFIALSERMNVSQAMVRIRDWAHQYDTDDITHVYVVDSRNVLIGDVALGALVLAHPYQLISLTMNTDVISVEVATDQEEVARLMERYDLRRIPVTDNEGRLLGR